MTPVPRLAAAAAAMVATVTLVAVGPLAAPAGSALPADVAVISSAGLGAALEVFSRVPAESDGGLLFTQSKLTADKAIAQAAGGTGGDLAETFSQSSNAGYRNPFLVTAQYPPSATVPAEARFEGGQEAPEGSPFAGRLGTIEALASDEPKAVGEAVGGGFGNAEIAIGSGASSSLSELRRDGALITRSQATVYDVVIGGVLRISEASSVAETIVPPGGPPTSMLRTTLIGARANGVDVTITPDGLRVADGPAAGKDQVAALNAAVAALAAQGITVVALPAERDVTAAAARAAGAAFVVRYSFAQQIGGDEEIALASVRSSSALERRAAAELPPDLGLSPAPAADPRSPPSPIASEAVPPTGSTGAPPGLAVPAPNLTRADLVPARGPVKERSAFAPTPSTLVPTEAAAPLPATRPRAPRPAPSAPDPALAAPDFGLSAAPIDVMAQELSSGYGVLVLCALAGVVLLIARMQSRLA